MTRKTIWAICAVILAGALATLIWMPVRTAEPPVPMESQTQVSIPSAKTASTGYTVKEYNGGIAVFADGNEVPFRITDIDIRTLPQEDQNQLKAGIQVTGLDEVDRLMEDYCS